MACPQYTSQIIEIHTKKGYVGIIDPIDADLVSIAWIARTTKSGVTYLHQNIWKENKRTTEQIQRLIMSRILGRSLTKSEYVDHEDRDGLNNRRENLRLCTFSQNLQNQKRHSNNTSGYKGVSFNKKLGKYAAYICANKKQKHLGYFTTPMEAHQAYCKAAKELHGKFARLT